MVTGVELIDAERQRQIEEEGFGADRDDAYVGGELARVAACYAASVCGLELSVVVHAVAGKVRTDAWPETWDQSLDKRHVHDKKKQLVIAGALLAAELDRIMRADAGGKKIGPATTGYIDIVFDGPPAHESGRFVEVENEKGEGIRVGTWVKRDDGYHVLRIPKSEFGAARVE